MTTRNEQLYRLAKEVLDGAWLEAPAARLAAAVLREHAPPEPRKWEGWGLFTRDGNLIGYEVLETNAKKLQTVFSGSTVARITATEVMEGE